MIHSAWCFVTIFRSQSSALFISSRHYISSKRNIDYILVGSEWLVFKFICRISSGPMVLRVYTHRPIKSYIASGHSLKFEYIRRSPRFRITLWWLVDAELRTTDNHPAERIDGGSGVDQAWIKSPYIGRGCNDPTMMHDVLMSM